MAPKLLGRGTEDAPRESRERNLLPQCRAVVQRSAKREAGSWSIHMFQELSLQEYFGCSSTEHRSRHEKTAVAAVPNKLTERRAAVFRATRILALVHGVWLWKMVARVITADALIARGI